MSDPVSLAEFSRILGCGKSWISQLKREGRLVLDANGRVLVEESKSLIASTASRGRATDDERLPPELCVDIMDPAFSYSEFAKSADAFLNSLPDL